MFTGIVQSMGKVLRQGDNLLEVQGSPAGVKIGDSVAVDGVCLTVIRLQGGAMAFDVSEETLRKTTLGALQPGQPVNLEAALRAGDPLGGHFVLGHVDGTGRILSRSPQGASVLIEFSIPRLLRRYLVPKGSVAVDGISLTVVEVKEASFTVAVIPHTEQQTGLGAKQVGDPVNLEADVLAKHVERLMGGWNDETTGELFVKKTLHWEED